VGKRRNGKQQIVQQNQNAINAVWGTATNDAKPRNATQRNAGKTGHRVTNAT